MKNKTPAYIKKYLTQQFNNINFEVEKHKYYNNDKIEFQSVSSFLQQFLTNFNSEKISKKISMKENIPQNEIKTQWNVRRDFSTVRGTEFHLYVETFLNENRKINIITPIKKEIELFHQFWDKRNQLKYEIITTELIVYCEKLKLAGTIDCVVRHKKTKNFFIMDWKTNKIIREKSPYFIKMKNPINHLDECEINKYSLQMGLYSKILSDNSDLDIAKCFIIHFSNELNNYKIFVAKNFSQEIDSMLNAKKIGVH